MPHILESMMEQVVPFEPDLNRLDRPIESDLPAHRYNICYRGAFDRVREMLENFIQWLSLYRRCANMEVTRMVKQAEAALSLLTQMRIRHVEEAGAELVQYLETYSYHFPHPEKVHEVGRKLKPYLVITSRPYIALPCNIYFYKGIVDRREDFLPRLTRIAVFRRAQSPYAPMERIAKVQENIKEYFEQLESACAYYDRASKARKKSEMRRALQTCRVRALWLGFWMRQAGGYAYDIGEAGREIKTEVCRNPYSLSPGFY